MRVSEDKLREIRSWVVAEVGRSQYRFSPSDREDAIQYAWIEAHAACRRWRKSRGASLHTFVMARIKGAIIDYARRSTGLLRTSGKPRLSTVPMDSSVFAMKDSGHVPEHLLDAAVRAIMGMNIGRSRAWAVLSAAAIKAILVHHLLDGQTMAKVAKMFKVTEGRISQIVTRYKSKAVEAVKDEIAPLCAWMN